MGEHIRFVRPDAHMFEGRGVAIDVVRLWIMDRLGTCWLQSVSMCQHQIVKQQLLLLPSKYLANASFKSNWCFTQR